MRRRIYETIAMIAFVAMAGSHALAADQDNKHLKRNKSPVRFFTAPSLPIGGYNLDDCPQYTISSVVEIHLNGGKAGAAILPVLASGKIVCANCLTQNNPDPGGYDDDDGKTGTPINPYTASAPQWPTPFDIDLSGNDTGNHPWWHPLAGVGYKPILIKIILEDNTTNFYQPKGNPSGVTDSEWVVRPGGNYQTMFTCLSAIKTNTAGYKYVTLRTYFTQSSNGAPVIGGLNIGLLTQQGSTWLPIYIDPTVKNNG